MRSLKRGTECDRPAKRLPVPRRQSIPLGNLLGDPNWLLGSRFCRTRCWVGYYDRIGNRLRNIDGFRAGLMSTNQAGSPCSTRRDCLASSLRYFCNSDCTSSRIPRDDLTGISCQRAKKRPFFLIRTLSSKAYATSSWRAAKNPSSPSLSRLSVRTHGASRSPLSTCRSSNSSISSWKSRPS
jgi:hypothetical protein